MYRSAIEKLKKWKVSYFRKPLIIEGASPGWQDMADEGIRQGVL